ncbi:glycoside hydrolase family 127 protein [Sphingomonas piscis]|uniref:Glycoside hydrolase family 127 protein n=1 Tax=Sphingomonas piscis TaxID=2714943 RepID=A0A6G7YS85_9SPHN|nr:glycoside hydrolase family 127 protein [Sphingomonas piscis]QIK79594.1 glycoside hydrolase family 127 protein [Sphingomonas piscis]
MSNATACRLHSSRRTFLISTSALAFLPVSGWAATVVKDRQKVRAAPLGSVRLKPSLFADHVEANRKYLRSLEPERLLHNFYVSAGLPPKGERYGGWESQGIAGHSLGHWLTASSILIANGGDPVLAAKIDRALDELALIQKAQGDGYIGGTTVQREGKWVDGKIIFEEVRRGDIRTQGYDLNGGWVPIYTWHKVQAGLIDAYQLAGKRKAMPVLLGMADYLAKIIEGLPDSKIQDLLHAEHGGINEAYANLYALTGTPRWLKVAEKLRHKEVLDPLTARKHVLSGLHANTQIPKLIGVARLYELTGNPAHATAATFFHDTVTHRHSYVIGGNSEREHFGPAGQLQGRLTNATCEACNSYNMLKLTRHLFSWAPQGSLFDYYERTQLNHMLAHHRPDDGMVAYFMPMAAGEKRKYSTPENDFWCCVGSGMESAAKHADSIYWSDGETTFVNLFIPSSLDWEEQGVRIDVDTQFPDDGTVDLTLRRMPADKTLAVRIPSWASDAKLSINDEPAEIERRNGYAMIKRKWRAGDRVRLQMAMPLRSEPLLGDPSTVAFLKGPLVLAADLGPSAVEYTGPAPALRVEGDALAALVPAADGSFRVRHVLGQDMTLRPFFPLYDRRTAVYFKTFTPASWAADGAAFLAAEKARAELASRTIDLFHIGEQQPEQDHGFTSTKSEVGTFYGKTSRNISEGGSISFKVARTKAPSVLQLTYVWWERDRTMDIFIDGKLIATELRPRTEKDDWVVVDYPLPATDNPQSEVRLVARKGSIQVFGVRVLQTTAPTAKLS